MTLHRLSVRLQLALLALLLVLTACGGDGGDDGSGGGAAEGDPPRIAAVFAGTTTDADYNFLGLQALQAAEDEFDAEVTYSENVAVPDAERTIREYVADGYNVIWTHGSQFYDVTLAVAAEAPDVVFIAEQDIEPQDLPDNVWVLDRNFAQGMYPLGVLAGAATKTGTIAYLGGVTLPFSYSEVHAVEQALADSGSDATLIPVWTGDFNDPTKAQQITTQLIGSGADVILGSLNLGMVGAFEAVKQETDVLITAKYTDKSELAPDNYLTSVLYDFTVMLSEILTAITDGETGGYLAMTFDQGISVQPPANVDQEVVDLLEQTVEDIRSGAIEVIRDVSPVE